MAQEPARASHSNAGGAAANYEGRWRWWYASIADWMIRNPGGTFKECGDYLNKHPQTIGAIAGTDMFKEYLARRKEEFHKDHDYAIRSRLTAVAEQSMDLILDTMKKKGDQIPLARLESLASSALENLGYGVESAKVVVNTGPQNTNQVVVNVSTSDLEDARMAMRQAELMKAGSSTKFLASSPPAHKVQDQPEAELELSVCEDIEGKVLEEESHAPPLDKT
jgi:hypothetical protein